MQVQALVGWVPLLLALRGASARRKMAQNARCSWPALSDTPVSIRPRRHVVHTARVPRMTADDALRGQDDSSHAVGGERFVGVGGTTRIEPAARSEQRCDQSAVGEEDGAQREDDEVPDSAMDRSRFTRSVPITSVLLPTARRDARKMIASPRHGSSFLFRR